MGEFTRPPTMSGGEEVGVLEGSLAVPRDGVVASCSKWRWRPPVMELHFVRGSSLSEFTAAAAAAGADAVIMDAAVWSKMPEEMMWEVVRFLPAAKLFQLQLVSRKWRQELTSAHFRKRRRLTELSWQEQRLRRFTQLSWQEQLQQQERVPLVTCVPPPDRDSSRRPRPGNSSSSNVNCRVLEVDLSFVPTWFWSRFQSRPRVRYCVVAAGHGVVCISNENKLQHKMMAMGEACEADRYCVLNPLTRTCIVLPPELPFPPDGWILLTSTSVTIWSKSTPDRAWRLATYDLASGAGACWVWVHKLVLPSGCERSWWLALPGLGGQVEVNPLDAPRHGVAGTHKTQDGILVAHRGAVYLVIARPHGDQVAHVPTRHNVLCGGVWRLTCAPEGGCSGRRWRCWTPPRR